MLRRPGMFVSVEFGRRSDFQHRQICGRPQVAPPLTHPSNFGFVIVRVSHSRNSFANCSDQNTARESRFPFGIRGLIVRLELRGEVAQEPRLLSDSIAANRRAAIRSEENTPELQSLAYLHSPL